MFKGYDRCEFPYLKHACYRLNTNNFHFFEAVVCKAHGSNSLT